MKKRGLFALFLIVFLIISVSAFSFNQNLFSKGGELKVTLEHPFLLNGFWIKASELKVGDELFTIDGKKARITSIRDVNSSVDVYNLEVKDYSDFILSDGIVVHNSNKPIVNPYGIDCIGGSCPVRVRDPYGKIEEMTLGKFYYRFQNNPSLRIINAYGEEIPLQELVRIYDPDQVVSMVSFTVEGQTYKVTKNTRVQLASGEFVEARELIPGTRLRVPGSKGQITALNQYEAKGIQVFEPKFANSVYDTPFQVGGNINGPTLKNPYPSVKDNFLDSMGYGESTPKTKAKLYDVPDNSLNKDYEVFENSPYSGVLYTDDPEELYSRIRLLEENENKIFDSPIIQRDRVLIGVTDDKHIMQQTPANGKFIWTINSNGDLTLGLRESRQQFLPHSALSNGDRVFGAGEIVFENGRIIEVNPKSGHYIPKTLDGETIDLVQAKKYSEQTIKVMKSYLKANGFTEAEINKIKFSTNVN